MQCYSDLFLFCFWRNKNCNWINVCPQIMHHIATNIHLERVCVCDVNAHNSHQKHIRCFILRMTRFYIRFGSNTIHVYYFFGTLNMYTWKCFMLMYMGFLFTFIRNKVYTATFKYSLCHVLHARNSNIDGFVRQSGCHKFFVHSLLLIIKLWLGLTWLGFGSNCLIYVVTNAKCMGQRQDTHTQNIKRRK